MKCSKCGRDAVLFQNYSGMHLCKTHFIADFEARAKKSIRKYGWISQGDSIAIAMSGGKDSAAVLHFMTKTFGMRRDISIFALSIDEGIAGYRDMEVVRKIAENYGVGFHSASFKEAYGFTLDDIVQREGDTRSCSRCGVLRRHILNKTARELGATKIALGFNLDDESQSVLMNALRGDVETLTRRQVPVEGFVPRIRPFSHLPEREVALYATLNVEGFIGAGCPYSVNALRADVREILNIYNYKHPATKYALINLAEGLKSSKTEDTAGPSICPVCGEPVFGECQVCRIVGVMNR